MFSWLGDIFSGLGDFLANSFEAIGDAVTRSIFDSFITWFYETIYGTISDFFSAITDMGAGMFDQSWVQSALTLFALLGWCLFVVGSVVAVFDFAIEYQNGRGNVRSLCTNVLTGFFGASLLTKLPVELYRFCVALQNTYTGELASYFGAAHHISIADIALQSLTVGFADTDGLQVPPTLLILLILIAFGYCVVSVFFQNLKRGGILMVQIAIGSLYLFSVPRGYTDGFVGWCKQVIAMCVTAFLQTTILFLGLLTFQNHPLLGLGVMLASKETPRIAQQFGLDAAAKPNITSAIHTTTTAVNLAKTIMK